MHSTPHDILAIEAEIGRRSLYEYFKLAWPTIEPGREFRDNWHIGAVAEHMQALYDGQIRRLIINIPPRHTKTDLVTVASPSYRWIDKPQTEFLCISHGDDIALRDAVAARKLIESRWYQERFGPLRFLGDQNQKGRFENDYGGGRVSTGILSGGTGENADVIIIDDPHDVTAALSETKRPTQVEALKTKWLNRLNDPKTGAVAIIMQRTHEADATGAMLAEGGWEHLMIPMEYDSERTQVTGIGWRDPRTVENELLNPDRFGMDQVREYRAKGELYYQTQYQQNPAPASGVIIKREWIKYWKPKGVVLPPVTFRNDAGEILEATIVDLPEKFDRIRQSWDATFKDSKAADRVAGVVGAFAGAECYLIDGIAEKMSFTKTLNAIRDMVVKQPQTTGVYIEDKANGSAILDTLRAEITGLLGVNPEGGKEARLWACEPRFAAGQIYFPHPLLAKWGAEAVEEVVRFPQAKYDDLVDAITQLLIQELNKITVNATVYRAY